MSFDVAIIQFAPQLGEVGRNLKYVESKLEGLSGIELVVLPELASTGYNFTDSAMARSLAENPFKSRYIDMLAAMASRNNQFIISGFNELSDEGIYNSSVLTGPSGPVGIYRKMHLFMREKLYFRPGDGKLEVYDTGFCRLGMQICFDYLFPEPWRVLAERNAEVIVHPSNLLTRNAAKALPGIALMNRVFIITANRIGTEGDLTFNGSSTVLDVRGEVMAKGPADEADIIFARIEPEQAHDKMITPMNHVFNDRRPEHYS